MTKVAPPASPPTQLAHPDPDVALSEDRRPRRSAPTRRPRPRIAEADLVIAENRDGWTVFINPTVLKDLLASIDDDDADRRVTVLVRPNLVPGDPFEATIQSHPRPRPDEPKARRPGPKPS